jgi:hypothetical protein
MQSAARQVIEHSRQFCLRKRAGQVPRASAQLAPRQGKGLAHFSVADLQFKDAMP